MTVILSEGWITTKAYSQTQGVWEYAFVEWPKPKFPAYAEASAGR